MDITAVAPALSAQSPQALPKDLEAACRALEEEFGTLVFRKMREAMVPKSAKGSSGFAQDTAQGLLESQWAQLASQGEGLGLWRTLYRQLEPAVVKSAAGEAEEKGTTALRPREVSPLAAVKNGASIAGRASIGHVSEKDSDTP